MKYILGILTFIVFLIFAFNLKSVWVYDFDEWGSHLLKGNDFLIPFHYIGEPIFVVIVAVLLLIWLWVKAQNFRGMIFVLITIAGGNLVNLFVKGLIKRDRPYILEQLTSFSFPSGHAMTGLLYLLTVAYITTEYQTKKTKVIAMSIATVIALCIGLSRVAESRHYLSDVVSGWALGYTVFALALLWYERRKRVFKQLEK